MWNLRILNQSDESVRKQNFRIFDSFEVPNLFDIQLGSSGSQIQCCRLREISGFHILWPGLPMDPDHYYTARSPSLFPKYWASRFLISISSNLESMFKFYFSGKIIALTTMLHSGSSTLCSLLQQVANEAPNPDSLIIYSNPDVCASLAAFCETYHEIGVKQMRKMLLTVLRYLCKDQAMNQTIVFRLRPSCIRLVPHLHSVAPHVMHIFMARDQLEHSISLFVNSKNDDHHVDLLKLVGLMGCPRRS